MNRSISAENTRALRLLPSIDEMLGTDTAIGMISELGRRRVLSLVREAAASVRLEIQERLASRPHALVELTRENLFELSMARLHDLWQRERNAGLRRVINATGVVIHTNLGRAPLSENARRAMLDAAGYCTIEYDVNAGGRGKRCANAEKLLASLTGAESALIVNNCAAAALLVLSVFAKGFDVLVSRGELVEIGGDFRIPDVLTQSGAALREVGTTNRTKLSDYEKAINERTALILRVHPSNYRITGFTEKPPISDLADLAHARGLLLYEDAGSGALFDLKEIGLADEPVISQSVAAGADIVSFSGDKLLGAPQSGLIVGRHELIERLRKHPLYRALRIDKTICAGLEATLEAYGPDVANTEIPVLRMLSESLQTIKERARKFEARLADELGPARDLSVNIIQGNSAVGGGAAPDVSPETALMALSHKRLSDHEIEGALRLSDPPVIARILDGKVVIDLRTVSESEEEELINVLKEIG